MNFSDIGGTAVILVSALIAGGAGYKFLEKILDLWSTSDARTSSSWREYAEKMEVRLDAAEADVGELRRALDAERAIRVGIEETHARRMSDMWKHVARLEKIIRDAGLHLPTDTPPKGTPAAGATPPGGE